MSAPFAIINVALLVPLAVIITYYDVRFRRIPNAFVLATLVSGLLINTIFAGVEGLLASLGGCALAFGLMFVLHIFGAMGAGDVKLFAAIGSVIGTHLVLPTFMVVVVTGGLLALLTMLRGRTVGITMYRVMQIFIGFLPGWSVPRFTIPVDRRHTIPYGVAITLGSLISVCVFRA